MDALIAALHDPRAYPHPTSGITLEETHISWVLLTGTYAYKIKKPVSLGFVDFSSLDRRRHFCQEELRLNRRLAPQIYLDLVEIHGPAEQASLLGPGPVVEVAVRMLQFDREGLLPRALDVGALQGEQLERFAARLAAFHGAAQVAPPEGPFGTPEAVTAPALANLEVLQRLHPELHSLVRLGEWTHREAERLRARLATRLAQGRVREGHGDLHLGNLVLHGGEVVAFDCLEFNPSLRWIDVLSDVAFLAMDLQQRGEEVLAGRMLNHWLNASGDYRGLGTWRWYLTYRALVRAKVLGLRLAQLDPQAQDGLRSQLDRYIRQAIASSSGAAAGGMLLTHGVSGSGKSFLAGELCRRHGWIHLRSDVERRRLFGRWGDSLDPLRDGDPYSLEVTRELYETVLPGAARSVLQAGLTVVVDATCLRRWERRIFESLAAEQKLPLVILVCSASREKAMERIVQRQVLGVDPSEADAAVLIRQLEALEPLAPSEGTLQIDAGSVDTVEEILTTEMPDLLRTTQESLPPRY